MDLTKVEHLTNNPFLKAFKNHRPEFLETLYVNNYKNLEFYIIQNSGNEEDARDIYQEGFLIVWRKIQLEIFKPLTEKEFSAYLFRVCKNKWIDQLRKNKIRVLDQTEDLDMISLNTTNNEDEKNTYIDSVKIHFQQLGDKCKEILNMFYYDKKNMKQISGLLGITEASAKNNKYRCLQKLREMVLNDRKEK